MGDAEIADEDGRLPARGSAENGAGAMRALHLRSWHVMHAVVAVDGHLRPDVVLQWEAGECSGTVRRGTRAGGRWCGRGGERGTT